MNRKTYLLNLILVLLIGLGSGFTGSYYFMQEFSKNLELQEVRTVSFDENSAVINAISEVSDSVVSIVALSEIRLNNGMGIDRFNDILRQFGFEGIESPTMQNPSQDTETKTQKVGGGTGFVISKDGLVLTNKHVVSLQDGIYEVFLNNGDWLYADVLSVDPLNDLAVLQLYIDEEKTQKPDNLKEVKLGNSKDLSLGSRVVAIGNALSEFENTSTLGIISGKNREITASGGNGTVTKLSNLLQTDASINPGNSGGPLVNLAGEVVGINTAIAQMANGIGFAIPIDEAKSVVESVKEYGRIVRPLLGVRYNEINPLLAKKFDLPVDYGAYLLNDLQAGFPAVIKGSPAFEAGLKSGDIITKVDEDEINKDTSLIDLIKTKKLDQDVKLQVMRDGQFIELSVTLSAFDLQEKLSESQSKETE